MDFDLRKPLWFLFIFFASITLIQKYYTWDDALAYAKKKPGSSAQAIEYYVGMAGYMRSNNAVATKAFEQLLADYPTSYYAPKAFLRLGGIYEEKFQWDMAKKNYELYLELFPDGKERRLIETKYDQVKFR